MPPTFLTLPRELRDRIYDYVWSDNISVWLRYASFKDELCFEAHELRFPEQPVKRYPPPGYTAPEPATLRKETLQFFFSTRNVTLDADGVASIRFLWQLPTIAREAITTISIGGFALQTDDKYSSAAWFGIAEEPEYKHSSGLTLITPFAAFLASHLPKLNQINLYLPWSGTEDWCPTLAPIELSLLLKFRRIKYLNFVFMGEDVVKTLRNGKLRSRECYERLMGRFKDCERLAEHEFELEHPAPEMRSFDKNSHKKMMEYVKRRHEYVEQNRREFSWAWAERDIEMGSDGNVQAVVRCWAQ
ncbi:hypothetical protein HII31_10115 [Pseudocercospora fuligena]|uniref:Uncharacterized protein n=1 Tax=Pseudocercospora fuligena TaxID=685502 RepID=A0A8H6RCE8_9PEZI|nr:hypothetical protein HII31_10115 [Pseudocercospora fuligena]